MLVHVAWAPRDPVRTPSRGWSSRQEGIPTGRGEARDWGQPGLRCTLTPGTVVTGQKANRVKHDGALSAVSVRSVSGWIGRVVVALVGA